MLSPANLRLQAGKLPHPINQAKLHSSLSMAMARIQDLRQRVITVPLMRNPHLMMTGDSVLMGLHQLPSADKMLRFDAYVAQEFLARCHRQELVGGHGLPQLADYIPVVNL
jgi:hypothetical protein